MALIAARMPAFVFAYRAVPVPALSRQQEARWVEGPVSGKRSVGFAANREGQSGRGSQGGAVREGQSAVDEESGADAPSTPSYVPAILCASP